MDNADPFVRMTRRGSAPLYTAPPPGREKETRHMHQSLALAHIAHAHTLSFATAQSLVAGKVVTFAAIVSVLGAATNPFAKVFDGIAAWMGELALPATIIGLAISGIFMVLHHRAARDMLVGVPLGCAELTCYWRTAFGTGRRHEHCCGRSAPREPPSKATGSRRQ